MTASAAAAAVPPAAASHPGRSAMLLYGLLGFAAGLPFYMFSTVLALRLQAHGVALTVLGFFAWVQLLARELRFVDPLSGRTREFTTGLTLREAGRV